MVNRTTVSGGSTPPLTPSAFFNEYAERIDTLFDASALPLTAVGGTANAVTATLDPPLASAGVFVDGMKFTLTWAAANTAGVTLAINGGAALPVLDAAGTALIADAVGAGLRSLLEYIGGAFRILSPLLSGGGGGSSARYFWQFTASGTWNRPSGLDPDTMVIIEGWGGGGGGGSATSGGGGGGGYSRREVRVGDLPSSVAVTIGAGGAVNTRGGNTTFGSILTAYNGGGGASGNSGGGGGGGEIAQGGPAGSSNFGGLIGGGDGATTAGGAGQDAKTIWGGGGGGAATGGVGGNAVYGGGGGGANVTAAGGVSVRGGNGGAGGSAGQAPGGGGGRNAAGARGEVRIWI